MDDELKQHVKDSGAWMRLLFMLLFAAIFSVSEAVLTAVVVFQFLFVLFTGRRNDRVLSFGSSLSAYVYQVFRYLSYNSEERPFPFADWPGDRPLVAEAEPRPAATRPVRRRRSTAKANKAEPEASARVETEGGTGR
jgi:hypothetical protein